jgi:hypothetical protein
MIRDYYQLPESTSVMRFLWKCAGGDRYLLERSTYSDQIKYMCLGGIILATGCMAGLAGGYGFYTIFSPKTEYGELVVSIPHIFMSAVFGIIWGLIIFNIDKFIVTSTGKGDGTEKITWLEFKTAIPRIIMGMIIAVTISKPIEIRMFQSEIQAELIKKKGDQESNYREDVYKRYKQRLDQLDSDIKVLESFIKTKKDNLDLAQSKAVEKCPNGGENCSVATHRQLWNFAKSENSEWEATKNLNNPKIISLNVERNDLLAKQNAELGKAQKDGQKLDGLLERIMILHEIAPWISIFITLLFLSIELTPIFFKLMLTKTTYDYLTENRDELLKADYGIEVQYDKYKDKEGVERHLTINHEAERIIFEKKMVTSIQKELTKYALTKYNEREKKKIDDNLDDYIKSIDG